MAAGLMSRWMVPGVPLDKFDLRVFASRQDGNLLLSGAVLLLCLSFRRCVRRAQSSAWKEKQVAQ